MEMTENQTTESNVRNSDAVYALMRFLRVLWYRKLYVFAGVSIAVLLGGFYYFTATRVYQSTASLLVITTGTQGFSATMSADTQGGALIPTYERLFTSATVLRGALDRIKNMPPDVRVDFAGVPQDKWVDTLRKNIVAAGVRRTNIINLSYRSQSPAAAKAVVDALVESYLDFMERYHRDVSKEIVDTLETKLANIEGELDSKQAALRLMQQEIRDLGLPENSAVVSPIVQSVIELKEALDQTSKERIRLEASLTAIQAARESGNDLRTHLIALEPVVGRELMMNSLGIDASDSDVISNMQRNLAEKRATYLAKQGVLGAAHYEMVKLSNEIQLLHEFLEGRDKRIQDRAREIETETLGPMLESMVREKLASAWANEVSLRREFGIAENAAVALNDKRIDKQFLEHDYSRLQSLFDVLTNQVANIKIKDDQPSVRVAVVSNPVIDKVPVSPRATRTGALALMAGLVFGMAYVYVVDALDDRFRSPEELSHDLGVPVLAMVRQLPVLAESGPQALQTFISATSVESEAFRTLRTTLSFSGEERDRIAITSSEPGDGKTTVLANLAVAYSQVGKRTLVIDADLRRPGLTRLFAMKGQQGLSTILRSAENLDDVGSAFIQNTGIDGLDILACGPKPSNPAELLSSERFSELLGWADTRYDQVLIDCPPVLAASDASIVGRLTDGMVLVVQPEKNHRRLVLRAADGLDSIGVDLIGVVANRVGEDSGGYYGYGQGYGYGYGYGYGHEEDEDNLYDSEYDQTPQFQNQQIQEQQIQNQNQQNQNQQIQNQQIQEQQIADSPLATEHVEVTVQASEEVADLETPIMTTQQDNTLNAPRRKAA
ncbi:MAG: succinoglycan biosynthesis transport protein ExoP [Pirellulaceae bacterium]|jgi:capsular exopolysaccharide synthesis family protein